MDGRCATCTWWEPDAEPDVADDSDDGPETDPWGRCTRVDIGLHAETTRAVAVADGFGEAFLDTAHDFGCTQYEPSARKDP